MKSQLTILVCHILYEYCGCTENSVTEKQFILKKNVLLSFSEINSYINIIIIVVYMECKWAIVKKRGGGIYTVSPLHVLIILIQSDVGGTQQQRRGVGSILGTQP